MALRWAVNFGEWHPDADEWERGLALVGTEERARIGRFCRPQRGGLPSLVGRTNPDAKSALVGRLLLRRAAHDACGIPFADIRYARTREGKPYLVGHEFCRAFHANVSHHGCWVALASEPHDIVGVDVMQTALRPGQRAEDFLSGMRHVLTPREWAQVDAFPLRQMQRLDAFFTLWTLKESLIKATGQGLGFDLQRISFTLGGAEATAAAPVGDPPVTTEEQQQLSTMTTRPRHSTVAIDGNQDCSGRWAFTTESLDELHMVSVCRAAPAEAYETFRAVLSPDARFDTACNADPDRPSFARLSVASLLDC